MRAALVDVQLGRDSGFAQGEVEQDAVFRRDAVVRVGGEEKRGWSAFGDLVFVGKQFNKSRVEHTGALSRGRHIVMFIAEIEPALPTVFWNMLRPRRVFHLRRTGSEIPRGLPLARPGDPVASGAG